MKKIFLAGFVCLLPYFASAQNDNPISEDFYTDTRGITNVVHLDDHINIIQVDNNNDNFDLIALDVNMRTVWRTTMDGYGVNIGKYNGKIAVVAAAEHSTTKGNGNTYKGFIIDPANGKTLAQKVIYEDNNDYIEVPKVLIGDNYFKFCVRQTNCTRKMHVGIPVFVIFQATTWDKELNETQKLEVIDLNEKLETVNTVNPVVNGTFINITCNTKADMFVSMLNGPDIEVYKYKAGQSAPSVQLDADVSIKPNNHTNLDNMILFNTSKTKPDDLFYTLLYLNEDKDPELILGKMDFTAKTKKSITQVFKKADIKALEKTFVPVNKKLEYPDIGSPKSLEIKNVVKTDNKLIITLGGEYSVITNYGSYVNGMSLLLNVFDDDLQPKFQQFLPTNYYYPGRSLPAGFHVINNKLYVAGNTKKGGGTVGVYGVLDLDNGQWDSMDYLIKKNIKGYLDAINILWYEKGFIAPYMQVPGYFYTKYNLGFQQNDY